MAEPQETKYFHHDLKLSAKSHPPSTTFAAKLAYWTFGDPSNPAILLPTCYGGTLATTLPFLYNPSAATPTSSPPIFPTTKYFIIVVGLLGGSESSSPSNTSPHHGTNFPHTTYEDNIRLQHALCTQHLGVTHLHAYIGFSMGGQQAYHMSALFPDFATHAVCLAGSARTSWHNWCFLEGPKAALTSAADFRDGEYEAPAKKGVRAFGRVYSAWALSQAWFRERCWEQVGFGSLEEYLRDRWDDFQFDANDLLCMLWTWQNGDIGVYHEEDGGDLGKALGRIKARMLLLPSRTDAYFPPEDNEEEVKHLKDGKFVVIPSIWGHLAGGGGGTKEDNEFIKQQIAQFLGISR
ncbi:homoserine acetyltransferase [Viridothelium virens]|uniref:Homoserine acetyltransferase n=1 Tax=Viridothelium virens TaxID=1048519 RepID=A0A6A6HMF0_VIRVR|nr:homoserine acetyltransferase [Viridothelium virens]